MITILMLLLIIFNLFILGEGWVCVSLLACSFIVYEFPITAGSVCYDPTGS